MSASSNWHYRCLAKLTCEHGMSEHAGVSYTIEPVTATCASCQP